MARRRAMNLGFGTNPDNVNLSALPPQSQGQPGGFYEQKENRWQMFQLVDAGPSVAGDVGYLKLSGINILSYQATRTIGNSTANLGCGIFTTAVTVNYYTLLRLGGGFKCKSEASFDGLGDQAFPFTANNSLAGVDAGTAPTNPPIAIGLEARGGTTAGFTTAFLKFQYV